MKNISKIFNVSVNVLLLSIIIAALFTFIFPQYVPIQDGWAHCYTLFCLRSYAKWHNILSINYSPYAGWITPFSMYPFVLIGGYVQGLKIYTLVLLFALFLAYKAYLSRYVNNRLAIITLSGIVSLNLFLIKGFFSFIIGLILFLLFITVTSNKSEDEKIKYFIILTIIEIFIHPFYFAESILLLFWTLYTTKLKLKVSLKLILSSFFLFLAMFYLMRHKIGFEWRTSLFERLRLILTGGYIFPWFRSKTLGLLFLVFSQVFVLLMPFFGVYSIFKNRWYDNDVRDSDLHRKIVILTALTNFILYFTIFDVFKTGSYIHTRQMFIFLLLIIPFVVKDLEIRYRVYFEKAMVAYLLVLLLFDVLIINEKFRYYSDKFSRFVDIASEKVEYHSRFITIVKDNLGCGYAYPLTHLGGTIGILNNSLYLNNLDFLTSYKPLKLNLSECKKQFLRHPHLCDDDSKYVLNYIDYIIIINIGPNKDNVDIGCPNLKMLKSIYKDTNLVILARQ